MGEIDMLEGLEAKGIVLSTYNRYVDDITDLMPDCLLSPCHEPALKARGINAFRAHSWYLWKRSHNSKSFEGPVLNSIGPIFVLLL